MANKKCVVCSVRTGTIVHISYRAVTICQVCTNKITLQNVKFLIQSAADRKWRNVDSSNETKNKMP